MSVPGRIVVLIIDDLRGTANSMQQVLDASQITGAGAWLLDQLPNMLDDLAIRFGG